MSTRYPLLLALFSIVVWGLSFAATRDAVQQIPPITLAAVRFSLATALLWPLTCKRPPVLLPSDRKWIWALAFTGITFYYAFENFGLRLTTASHASLIVATIPLGTTWVSAWLSNQRPRKTACLGGLLAFGGVALLVGHKGGGASPAGDLLMFGAVGSWIAYTFLVNKISGRYPNLLVTRWIMQIGAVSLVPPALLELFFRPLPRPDLRAVAEVSFLVIFCSALAYDFWNRAVPLLGPVAINNLLYFIPLVGVLGGIVLLGEPVTAGVVWGGALILCGVFVAHRV